MTELPPCKSDDCLDPIEQIARKRQPINQIDPILQTAFEDKCRSFGNALNLYQRLATRTAIYPGQGSPLGLAYVALKLNGEAGELAEHVGKAMRDDDLMGSSPVSQHDDTFYPHQLTHERRMLIIKEIGDVLWYLSAACNELDITLSEAAVTNIRKLKDRQERDALQGSGDDR